jgi:hypothetical protein
MKFFKSASLRKTLENEYNTDLIKTHDFLDDIIRWYWVIIDGIWIDDSIY